MSRQKELDESESKKTDSSDETVGRTDKQQEEEEEIIDLEDIVELPDESLGDILSDLEEQSLDREAAPDDGRISFELESERNAGLDEDLLSELFKDEEVAPEEEAAPKTEPDPEPEKAKESLSSAVQLREKDSQLLEEILNVPKPEEVIPAAAGAIRKEILIEEAIDQLEERLLETVQRIVESRLPDIVRTALREEIERLKEELTGSLSKK